ncbi:MAG TPA: trypsin-like peptidase domain-containing protein [Phycisphaerae bacterium]|jgi:hypothetical protein
MLTVFRRFSRIAQAALALYGSAAAGTLAADETPFRKDPYVLHTGVHHSSSDKDSVVFRHTIHVPGAVWLRLTLSDYALGQASFISIRSVQTGAMQSMTAVALETWHNNTAFFGGDTLEFELHVAPGERNIFAQLSEVWVGLPTDPDAPGPANGGDAPEDLCGADNRVASSDPRVGRIFGSGCTAWLVANGAFVTAGHCVDGDPDGFGPMLPDGIVDNGFLNTVVEFNVPSSSSNGVPQPALPQDQYPVSGLYVAFQHPGEAPNFDSIGVDWAVFHVGPNANGVTPQQAQNSFFRVSGAASSTVGQTMRVTGYGLDWTPNGTGGAGAACCDFNSDNNCDFICNAQSYTEQTSTGVCTDFVDNGSRAWFQYEVDTTPATSGSPVIREANGEALGINTNSGCSNGGNYGTTFDQDVLHDFLNEYIYGPGVEYADAASYCGPPLPFGCSGTIFNPHDTIPAAVADVADGANIVIIPGNYTAANGNVFTAGADGKAMTLRAPFGGVVIGN